MAAAAGQPAHGYQSTESFRFLVRCCLRKSRQQPLHLFLMKQAWSLNAWHVQTRTKSEQRNFSPAVLDAALCLIRARWCFLAAGWRLERWK